MEGPVAVEPVAGRRNSVSVENRRTLVEEPVRGLGRAPVEALGDPVAVLGHGPDLVDRNVKGSEKTEKVKFLHLKQCQQ